MTLKTELVGLLRAVADAIDNLTRNQYDLLISGRGSLYFKEQSVDSNTDLDPMSQLDHGPRPEIVNLAEELLSLDTRNEAEELLKVDTRVKLKADLVDLGKILHVNVLKSDSKSRIIEKIADATVGSKVRAGAIQSLDLKSK